MRHSCPGFREIGRASRCFGAGASGAFGAFSLLASLASGCSGVDETRVAVLEVPRGAAQDEERLQPGSDTAGGAAMDGAAGSGGSEPGPVDEPLPPVAGGTATGNESRPWIDDLSDWRVFRGESVLLSGGQLMPNPSVIIGNRVVAPLEASLMSLKFVVPEDLELARCEVTFKLLVKTDLGLSPSVELAVLEQPPKITLLEARVAPGQVISPRVEPEGRGVLELDSPGRARVRVQLSPDGSTRIPPDAPEGPAVLRWITPCGEALVAIDVEAGSSP